MATLTVNDDVLLDVDELAKKEEVSREEFVDTAIRVYLNKKRLEETGARRREYAANQGVVTEEETAEEISRCGEDGKNDAYLSLTKRSKLDIVESLFGIIPYDGKSLTELREERLARYENND